MDSEHKDELEILEGLEQLVGYKAESFEQQGFFLQFSQSFENSVEDI